MGRERPHAPEQEGLAGTGGSGRRRLGVLLAIVGLAVMVPPTGHQALRAQGLTVTGYADVELWFEKLGSDNTEVYFDNHHVNLILLGKINGSLYAAVEVEYEHAGEEIALEYGYFGYTGIKDVRILGGKFIVPFGRFNKDIHPTPINKTPFRPYGFDDILPQTYNDVGLWVSMAKPAGQDNRVVIDAFVVNGLLGDDGGGIRGMRDNDRERADYGRDDNKSVGGRLGFEMPFVGLDVGASIYTGKYAQTEAGEALQLTLWGFDAAFRKHGFELRGEIVGADQEATGGSLTKTGGYVQAAYMIRGRFEPVVRFSTKNMPAENNDRSRLEFGASYVVSPASTVRLVYGANMEKSGFKQDNNALALQFNVLF